MAGFGGLVMGAVFWAVIGYIAAEMFSRMPGGAREGGGAMAGFFFVGPVAGLVGVALGGWGVWRLLADASRTSTVGWTLAGVLAVLIVGSFVALQPKTVLPDHFNGRRAEWQVEVSFPAGGSAAAGALRFEFRSADGTEEFPALRDRARKEGERTVIPGTLVTRMIPRSKLLAVMSGDSQLVCSTLNVEGRPEETTEWSPWQDLEEGFQARWRLVVAP